MASVDKRNLVKYVDPFLRLNYSTTGMYRVKGLESTPLLIAQVEYRDSRTDAKLLTRYFISYKRASDGTIMSMAETTNTIAAPGFTRLLRDAEVSPTFAISELPQYGEEDGVRDPKEFNAWLRAIKAAILK